MRLWKGSHVMALGCIPSHASYFLTYEKLKIYFGVNNEEFDYKSTLCIGASTTFVHDFFITPSDGKFTICFRLKISGKITTVTMQ